MTFIIGAKVKERKESFLVLSADSLGLYTKPKRLTTHVGKIRRIGHCFVSMRGSIGRGFQILGEYIREEYETVSDLESRLLEVRNQRKAELERRVLNVIVGGRDVNGKIDVRRIVMGKEEKGSAEKRLVAVTDDFSDPKTIVLKKLNSVLYKRSPLILEGEGANLVLPLAEELGIFKRLNSLLETLSNLYYLHLKAADSLFVDDRVSLVIMREDGEFYSLFHPEVLLGQREEADYLNSVQGKCFRMLDPGEVRDSRQHVLLREMVGQFYFAFFSDLFRFSRAKIFGSKKLDQKRERFSRALETLFSHSLDSVDNYLTDFETRSEIKRNNYMRNYKKSL